MVDGGDLIDDDVDEVDVVRVGGGVRKLFMDNCRLTGGTDEVLLWDERGDVDLCLLRAAFCAAPSS